MSLRQGKSQFKGVTHIHSDTARQIIVASKPGLLSMTFIESESKKKNFI
jgi:hypothetical protein